MFQNFSSVFSRHLASPSFSRTFSSAMSNEFSIAYVTAPSTEVAKSLSTKLLENKLVACVNLIPGVKSMYWWQDKIDESDEVIMMMKTRSGLVEELTTFVRQNHPYEVAEVIVTPITHGNPPYLDWITASTKAPSPSSSS
eukprot:GILI01038205.1.p1 GENE.GILI01038205.1~~GILI01038205.1.p1  ORF type:complete len:140 (-),score=17.28 GILI01038205.1:67-486(-)